MIINKKYKFIDNKILLMAFVLFWSCTEPVEEENMNPFINTEFTYHQDSNELYFGVLLYQRFNGVLIDTVYINWFGTNFNNSPGYITLFDDGTNGDIIKNDNLYACKIENTLSTIGNIITEEDTSNVYIMYNAKYGSDLLTQIDTVKIGNIIPKIKSVDADSIIIRPSGTNVSLNPVYVDVYDANGLETINWVGFTSYHVEGDTMMNDGNYIFLYDDGSEVILYEPNFTSGDVVKGDGIYTFRIPVYGVESDSTSSFYTKPGTFKWRFSAQDFSNGYSQVVEHEIIIQ